MLERITVRRSSFRTETFHLGCGRIQTVTPTRHSSRLSGPPTRLSSFRESHSLTRPLIRRSWTSESPIDTPCIGHHEPPPRTSRSDSKSLGVNAGTVGCARAATSAKGLSPSAPRGRRNARHPECSGQVHEAGLVVPCLRWVRPISDRFTPLPTVVIPGAGSTRPSSSLVQAIFPSRGQTLPGSGLCGSLTNPRGNAGPSLSRPLTGRTRRDNRASRLAGHSHEECPAPLGF